MAYDDPNESGDHFERSALEDTAPRSKPSMPGRGVSLTRTRLLGGVPGIALIAVVGVALFHDRPQRLTTSDTQPAGVVTVRVDLSIATESPTPIAFPAFTDWRVAYLGEDTRLHIVSTDGKMQLTGPSMPIRGALGAIQGPAAASPDGRNLAYPAANGTVITQLTTANVAFQVIKGLYYDLAWSPGSDMLALGTRGETIELWRPGQIEASAIYQRSGERADLIGWIDETHLAIQRGQGHLEIDSLNIATGAVSSLTILPLEQLGDPFFTIAPDGRHILMTSCAFRGEPFIHRLGLIDTATGAYRSLINTRTKADSCLDHVAFQQDTGRFVTLTTPENQTHSTVWIVDPQRDVATLITPQNVGYPVAWAPGGGPMITSTAYQLQEDGGPYTIRAIPASFAYDPSVTTLATSALTLPLLGLVRAA